MQTTTNRSYWFKVGFPGAEDDVEAALKRLAVLVDELPQTIRSLREEDLLSRSAPGKWSKKEQLGHLVDSAINNLKRFSDIQHLPHPYKVVSYNQDELVKSNNYQALPLEHLLGLWQALNRQVIFAIKNIPREKLSYAVDPNFENGELKTLAWLIGDYVAHLEHHFRQLK